MITERFEDLTIGELARRADVNVQTVRYYERRGLLPEPARSGANYRIYPEETARRIRFIKRAKELGFSLKEIKELLSLRATPGASCEEVRERSEAKLEDIALKIRTLEAMRTALTKLVSTCSGQGPVTECPILDSIEPKEQA